MIKKISQLQKEFSKKLDYIYSYIQVLWNLVLYPGHAIECEIVHEICCFSAAAFIYFENAQQQEKFFEMISMILNKLKSSSKQEMKGFY